MADESDQQAGDGAEHCCEEAADTVCGLDLSLRNTGGDLYVHEQNGEQCCAKSGGDQGLGVETKQFLFHCVNLLLFYLN